MSFYNPNKSLFFYNNNGIEVEVKKDTTISDNIMVFDQESKMYYITPEGFTIKTGIDLAQRLTTDIKEQITFFCKDISDRIFNYCLSNRNFNNAQDMYIYYAFTPEIRYNIQSLLIAAISNAIDTGLTFTGDQNTASNYKAETIDSDISLHLRRKILNSGLKLNDNIKIIKKFVDITNISEIEGEW